MARETKEIRRRSPLTGQVNTMVMNVDLEDIAKWQRGELIQKALPYLTADEREFLMTGYTPEDWQTLFGKK